MSSDSDSGDSVDTTCAVSHGHGGGTQGGTQGGTRCGSDGRTIQYIDPAALNRAEQGDGIVSLADIAASGASGAAASGASGASTAADDRGTFSMSADITEHVRSAMATGLGAGVSTGTGQRHISLHGHQCRDRTARRSTQRTYSGDTRWRVLVITKNGLTDGEQERYHLIIEESYKASGAHARVTSYFTSIGGPFCEDASGMQISYNVVIAIGHESVTWAIDMIREYSMDCGLIIYGVLEGSALPLAARIRMPHVVSGVVIACDHGNKSDNAHLIGKIRKTIQERRIGSIDSICGINGLWLQKAFRHLRNIRTEDDLDLSTVDFSEDAKEYSGMTDDEIEARIRELQIALAKRRG